MIDGNNGMIFYSSSYNMGSEVPLLGEIDMHAWKATLGKTGFATLLDWDLLFKKRISFTGSSSLIFWKQILSWTPFQKQYEVQESK